MDIQSRKQQIHGLSYNCFKKGHLLKDCTCSKTFVFCKKGRNHHQNRFLMQLPVNSTRNNGQLQTSFVVTGEQIMMQTALAKVSNPSDGTTERVRLLLDYGCHANDLTSQKHLARKLNLNETETNRLPI